MVIASTSVETFGGHVVNEAPRGMTRMLVASPPVQAPTPRVTASEWPETSNCGRHGYVAE
jgi:hypothetical protein